MKWLYGLLCLFFLIIFHELGHFIAAKIFKVKVESFSIGFGPILFHKMIKGTDFRLSLIPLGGYCGMKGENDFKKALEENSPSIQGDKDSLYGIHPLKRAGIGFAGPFFNFIFAIIAFSFINLIGYTYYSYSNKIILADELYEDSSMAARNAGLLTGDEIIEINGNPVSDFSQIIQFVSICPDEDINIKVNRNNTILEFVCHTDMDKSSGSGKIGVAADQNSLIEKHTPKYNVFTAFGQGIADSINTVAITFKSFSILFKGVELQNAVSGPVGVTEMLGSTVKEGFSQSFKVGIISLLNLMAIISISLCIMNLLPIPLLDGGLILIAIIESITRKKINPKLQYYIQFIGIAFILILLFIGLFGDISYLLKGAK